MLSLQVLWTEAATPLAEGVVPTNPSSLTLALLGVVGYVTLQMLARPGHQSRDRRTPEQSTIPTPHSSNEQIRPRRRVA